MQNKKQTNKKVTDTITDTTSAKTIYPERGMSRKIKIYPKCMIFHQFH